MVYWLAGHYARHDVTVNAIAPALIEGTAMLPTRPDLRAAIPVGRFGTTEETTDLAISMLSNGYLTGKVVLLDGGIHPR